MVEIATGDSDNQARKKVEEAIDSGAAKKKFLQLVEMQHGDIDDLYIKETAYAYHYVANFDGVVSCIDAQTIGEVALELGAGRLTKESELDYDAGVKLLCKQGDHVKAGDPLFTIFTNLEGKDYLLEKAFCAYQWEK